MSKYKAQSALRKATVDHIIGEITACVAAAGETVDDLKKYTRDIEETAWDKSKGVQVCRAAA
jgi:hypothetical protein